MMGTPATAPVFHQNGIPQTTTVNLGYQSQAPEFVVTLTDDVTHAATTRTIENAGLAHPPEFTVEVSYASAPPLFIVTITKADARDASVLVDFVRPQGGIWSQRVIEAPWPATERTVIAEFEGTWTVNASGSPSSGKSSQTVDVLPAPLPAPDFLIEWNPYGSATQPFSYALWFRTSAEADDYTLDRGDGNPPIKLGRAVWAPWGVVHAEYPDSVAAGFDFAGPGALELTLSRDSDPRSKTTLPFVVNQQPFFDIAGWENNAYRVYIKPPSHPNHAFHIDWGDGVVDINPPWTEWSPAPGSYLTPHTYAARGPVNVIVNASYWQPPRQVVTALDVQRIRPIFVAMQNDWIWAACDVTISDSTSGVCLIDWGDGLQNPDCPAPGTYTHQYAAFGHYRVIVYDQNDAGTWQTYSEQVVYIAEQVDWSLGWTDPSTCVLDTVIPRTQRVLPGTLDWQDGRGALPLMWVATGNEPPDGLWNQEGATLWLQNAPPGNYRVRVVSAYGGPYAKMITIPSALPLSTKNAKPTDRIILPP